MMWQTASEEIVGESGNQRTPSLILESVNLEIAEWCFHLSLRIY